MTEAEFPQMWESAIALAEIRGWEVVPDPVSRGIHVTISLDPEQAGVYKQTFYRTPVNLRALLALLENGPLKPTTTAQVKARARYAFGFTDLKEIYGTIP